MIRTNNPGILEAIAELRRLSLKNSLRLWYEAYLKRVRDDRAWRKYVWKQAREEGLTEGKAEGRAEGRAEGKAEGRAEGEEYKLVKQICKKLRRGKSADSIAEELEEDLDKVYGILKAAKNFAPDYDADKVMRELLSLEQK